MLWYEYLFIYATYVVYILYFLVSFHISSTAPKYLLLLNYFRQLFVGLMLVYFFNPLRKKIIFNDFHRKIIFTTSLFLLIPIIRTPSVFYTNSSKITSAVRNYIT